MPLRLLDGWVKDEASLRQAKDAIRADRRGMKMKESPKDRDQSTGVDGCRGKRYFQDNVLVVHPPST